MKSFARSCVVMILAASLLDLPAMAASEKPLGVVVQVEHARLGNTSATLGTTVYSGDSFATEGGGALRLKIGTTTQFYLAASSAATVARSNDLASVTLIRGTGGFSSAADKEIEMETPAGIVRGADGQAAYGQVAIMSPTELIVSAYHGSLILDNDGDIHMIAEGKSYRVVIEQEPEATPPAGDSPVIYPRKRRRRLAFFLIFLGATALISYGIWDKVTESPSHP
jgi:hypothetical protein